MPLPIIQGGDPVVVNLTLTDANTEYAINLGAYTKKFVLQNRGTGELKIAFKVGESGSNYFTIKPSAAYYEDFIHAPITIYIQSAIAGTIVELINWVGRN